MRNFEDRLSDLLQPLSFNALESMIGIGIKIVDRKFGKIFIGTILSAEFRPIEPGSSMGTDSLRFVINGVPHESGMPIIELRLKDGELDWKIAFGNFQNAADLRIHFLR